MLSHSEELTHLSPILDTRIARRSECRVTLPYTALWNRPTAASRENTLLSQKARAALAEEGNLFSLAVSSCLLKSTSLARSWSEFWTPCIHSLILKKDSR